MCVRYDTVVCDSCPGRGRDCFNLVKEKTQVVFFKTFKFIVRNKIRPSNIRTVIGDYRIDYDRQRVYGPTLFSVGSSSTGAHGVRSHRTKACNFFLKIDSNLTTKIRCSDRARRNY